MNTEQQKLITRYEQLDPTIKKIVQVAAVAKPMARTSLIELSVKAGVTHENGRTPSYKQDRDALNQAIDEGLLCYVSKAKTGSVEVAAALVDYVFRQALSEGLAKAVVKAIDETTPSWAYRYRFDEQTAIRKMRFAFYDGEWETWKELTECYPFQPILLSPFCLDSFKKLKPKFQAEFVSRASSNLVNYGGIQDAEFAGHIESILRVFSPLPEKVIVAAIDLFAAQGNVQALENLAERIGKPRAEIQGCISFLKGDYDSAREIFETSDAETRKRTKKRKIELKHVPSLFYGLLLLKENSPAAQKKLRQIAKVVGDWKTAYRDASAPLSSALAHQLDPMGHSKQARLYSDSTSLLEFLLTGWNWCWFFSEQKPPFPIGLFKECLKSYQAAGVNWMAAELAAILSRATSGPKEQAKLSSFAEAAHTELGTASLVDFIRPAPIWEAGLTALENLCDRPDVTRATQSQNQLDDERLIWELQYHDGGSWFELTPFIQKLGSKGWSKGRKVALSRLYEQWQTSSFEFLTEQDQAICRCLSAKDRSQLLRLSRNHLRLEW